MAEVFGHPIPCRVFTRQGNKLVAEISDFGKGFDFHVLYDDAFDLGLTVQHPKGLANFYCLRVERREGEVYAYHLLPTDEALQRFSTLHGVEMVVFND